ncbi:uncharacterized protein LOC130982314 isoform X1 [Arachis stenosperma]|uniref:uncharacterized protein LOC130982314 isoform X1 n=1 Tax=Arachis stenosperma TaxID=217475 RepID=UPI0025AC2710|nr:uncharacterized protein LOC130982314 isoform X1 [Arachis stenosperma]
MDCNKEEAMRAKDIAQMKMKNRDFTGARKFALKAQKLYPHLENLAQMISVCDVHCSAEQKLFGNEMDWYGILQLEQTASDETIKKHYRKFALLLHPDKNNFVGAEAAFKLIGEAQRVLLDKDKRYQHDMKRGVPVNKTASSCHNQQKAYTNSNSSVKTNVRHNFTNSSHRQQQSRQTAQQGPNNSRQTFWTSCPFCKVKYQYYKEVLNKSLRCQNCHKPFIAFNVDKQRTSRANDSSRPESGQHKDDQHHGTSKEGPRAQGNLHSERSNTETFEKKGSANVSGKTNGNKKRKQMEESSESHSEIHDEVRGKQAAGGSKEMDENSEHSYPDLTSKAKYHPNVYLYPDAEFNDFDMFKRKGCFVAGQIWAIYDTADGMPRFYALIRNVLSPGFKIKIMWFEPHPDDNDEINWVNEDLPVACGKYKPGRTDITEDHLMFSYMVSFENICGNTFKVYPRKGEIWALYKNWDIKWYMDVESHQQYEFELVEILSDYADGVGLFVAYLFKLKGFVSLFCRSMKASNCSLQIPPAELYRFSHRVPSFKMNGEKGVNVPKGTYELDPACLPMNIEEIDAPEGLDMEIGHSSYGSENTTPLMTSEDVSAGKVNLERINLMKETKDSVNYSVNPRAPIASTSEAIEVPESLLFDFEAGRSFEKFHVGQIWAFYSDEDGLPKYYGQIIKIKTSPDVELNVTWLTCCWLPEITIRWEDEDMLISCGRFKINHTVQQSVYSNTSSISHLVHADPVGEGEYYAIFPSKGEVWAIYKTWSSKIKCSDLKNCVYDIVEVLGGNDLWTEVRVLELVSGFSSVFRSQSTVELRIPREELLRLSHQIPAFKLTEEHGNLRGFWQVDPGALPSHFSSK